MSVALEKKEKKAVEIFPEVSVASKVTGTGMFVPERVVSNEHFASYLDTSDQWIRERTGIVERRWAAPDVSMSDLAEPAARDAIKNSGLSVDDIDGIIVATVTPDYVFPSTACFLQQKLDIRNSFAFDVNAVCSGFVYAFVTADSMIRSGQCRNVLVVGADLYSRIIDPNDRSTCVLFGDGAGAVVLSSVVPKADTAAGDSLTVSGSAASIAGIYASCLGADGRHTNILHVPKGTAAEPTPESLSSDAHYLKMDGREVFKLAVRKLSEISLEILASAGIGIDSVDHFVSHQANQRILYAMARYLSVPEEKVPINLDKYGNTSAATLPILLADMHSEGTLKRGDLVLLSAFGGGVTWGASLLRW